MNCRVLLGKYRLRGSCSHCAACTLFQRPSMAALSAIFTHYSLTRAQLGRGHAGPLPPVVSCAGTPAGPGRRSFRRSAAPVRRLDPASALDDIGAPRPAPPDRSKSAPRPRAPETSATLPTSYLAICQAFPLHICAPAALGPCTGPNGGAAVLHLCTVAARRR